MTAMQILDLEEFLLQCFPKIWILSVAAGFLKLLNVANWQKN